MFGRHPTTLDHVVDGASRDRRVHDPVSARTTGSRSEVDFRHRLAGSGAAGLRERLARSAGELRTA